MKVILMENVETLGPAGSIKEVANGYARNYLLPRGIAVPATADALKRLERQRTSIERRAAQAADAAKGMADRLATTTVYIYAKSGEQNRLYGSVTTNDIAAALNEQHGLEIDRRNISLTEPIHRLGTYIANVKLTGGTVGKLNVTVDTEANRGKHLLVAAEAAAAPAEANTLVATDTAIDTANFTDTDTADMAIADSTATDTADSAIMTDDSIVITATPQVNVVNTMADDNAASVAQLNATPISDDAPIAEAQAEAEAQTGLGVDEAR